MSPIARRDVFQAIADPNRRAIIGLLAEGELNINAISTHFEMSRQAISLHIKILEECQIISIHREGRQRVCKMEFDALSEVHEWTSQFEAFWRPKMMSLGNVIAQNAAKRKR